MRTVNERQAKECTNRPAFKNMTKLKIPPLSEHMIQTQIISLCWMRGYFCMRLNSGKIRTEEGHLVNLAEPGTPDLLLFKPQYKVNNELASARGVNLIFFEVKSAKGKVTVLQELKMQQLEEYGAKCFIVRSCEDAEKYL